jgi:hypothetical protein
MSVASASNLGSLVRPDAPASIARTLRSTARRWLTISPLKTVDNSRRWPLPVKEVHVWLVDHARFLHPLTQVFRRGKRLRAIEILRFKKNDNLVGVVRTTKQVLLREPCGGARWLMSGAVCTDILHFPARVLVIQA